MAVPGKGLGKKLWSAAEMAALLGPGILLLAVRYARERDRWTPRDPLPPWQGVGRVQGLEAIPGGVRVRFAEAELEAVFLGEDLLRLTWSPGEALPPYALAEEASPLEPERLQGPDGVLLLRTRRLALALGEEGLEEARKEEEEDQVDQGHGATSRGASGPPPPPGGRGPPGAWPRPAP